MKKQKENKKVRSGWRTTRPASLKMPPQQLWRCWCVTLATPPPKPPSFQNGNYQQSISAVALMGLPRAPHGYCRIITGHSPSGPLCCPCRELSPKRDITKCTKRTSTSWNPVCLIRPWLSAASVDQTDTENDSDACRDITGFTHAYITMYGL